MDSFDHQEMAAIFGDDDFENYISPQYSFSSPEKINILSNSSITSFHNFPTTAPVIKQNNPAIDYDPKLPRVIIDDQDRPVVLNFGYHENNPIQSLRQVHALLPSHGVESNSAVVSQTSTSRGLENNITKDKQKISQPKKKKTRIRPPSQVYEHIIAERRRREQLSQLFIALSAIVPGLKKTDKTSILGEAINYLKHLEQRAQKLQETKSSMESGVFVKKSQVFVEEDGSSDEQGGSAEIEARVVNNNILIRVHCGKHKGILANLLSEVESMDMAVVSTNVSLFGNAALEITIIAETEKGFSLTVKEVATALRAAFRRATA